MENFRTSEQKSEISLDLSLRREYNFAASSEPNGIRCTRGNDSGTVRKDGNGSINSEALESMNSPMTWETSGVSISKGTAGRQSSNRIILCSKLEDVILSYPGSESRFFPCKYCNRKFFNSQALGGHQNAHRHERRTSALRRAEQTEALARSMYPKIMSPFQPNRATIPASSMVESVNSSVDDIIPRSDIGRRIKDDVDDGRCKAWNGGHDFSSMRYWGSLSSGYSLVLQRKKPSSEEAEYCRPGSLRSLKDCERRNGDDSIGSAEDSSGNASFFNWLPNHVPCVNPPLPPEHEGMSKLDLSLRL